MASRVAASSARGLCLGEVGCGGGISRTGSLPRSMCSRTNSRVRPGALHQRRRQAALLRAGEGGAVVHRQLAFVPTPEERGPRLPVVGVEARIGALLVGHHLDDLVDGGARWRQRDRDAADAQAPSSGRAEVRRCHVAGRIHLPTLPLMQGAPAETVVGRAVLVQSVARHCSPGGGGWRRWVEEVERSIGGDAGECGRPGAVGRDI
jgi:hypothetical protein